MHDLSKERLKDVEMKDVSSKEQSGNIETPNEKNIPTMIKTYQHELPPYLRKLPNHVEQIVGDDHVLFPIEGDGACGPRTFAAWIFQDPTLGPYLARNINSHFVQFWTYWKNVFSFPFVREVGNGGTIRCESEEELLDFFTTAHEGAYMWRGHEDFAVISNTYQLSIKIITIQSVDDEIPSITVIEPNPEFANCSVIPVGKLPDMTVLHHFDSHYSLIVPKDCWLAQTGGLDHQRAQKQKNKDKVKQSSEATVEERITSLEVIVSKLESKCSMLSEKNDNLEKLLNAWHIERNKTDSLSIQCSKCGETFSSEYNLRIHAKAHVNKVDSTDEVVVIRSKVIEDNIQNKIDKICETCGDGFPSDEDLMKHVELKHVNKIEKKVEYKCEECDFKCLSSLELKKHSKIKQHKSYDYKEVCYNCKKEFENYFSLMNHRKEKHPSNKVCRYFKKGECLFDEDTCWYKHVKSVEPEETITNNLKCGTCDNLFSDNSQLKKHICSIHEESSKKNMNRMNETYDDNGSTSQTFDADIENMDFQMSLAQKPPDLNQIIDVLKNLAVQVKNMQIV